MGALNIRITARYPIQSIYLETKEGKELDKMISQLGKPRNKNSKRLQMIYILFCAMLAGHATAETRKVLYTVATFDKIRDNNSDLNARGISMAGGADAMIFGSGFSAKPSDNIVSLTTDKLSSSAQTFMCPKLTILDEYHSKTGHGRLYYRLPSAEVMTEHRVKMQDFKAFDDFHAFIKVNTAEGDTLECSKAARCKAIYKWDHTPIWYFFSSPIMYSGKSVSLYMNPLEAKWDKREDKMSAEITLEGQRFLTEDYTVDWVMNGYQGLQGTVRSHQRTNNAELEVWFPSVGYALKHDTSANFCNWDGTDCYSARIYPHIDTISEVGGSVAGGQELTITGGDFKGAKSIEVTVDGVPCSVKSSTCTEIVCETGAKTLGAPQLSYPGEHGLYSSYDGTRELITSAEIPQSQKKPNVMQIIEGFYVAPVDGLYQFHMSCDDTCKFALSMSDPADPAAAEVLMNVGKHMGYRDFYYANGEYDQVEYPDGSDNPRIGAQFSLWVRLVGGTSYYMRNDFWGAGGDNHWTVGVEINPDVPIPDHTMLRPGRQGLFIHQDIFRDISQVRVRGADGGTFRLLMLKMDGNGNAEYWKSGLMNAGCHANSMRDNIKGYYESNGWNKPEVTLECGLSDGTVTPDCNDIDVVEHIYTVTVTKSIPIPSQLTVMPYYNTTQSDIEWIYSNDATNPDVQLSNKPLSGKYFIECSDTQGNPFFTEEIWVNENHKQIYNKLVKACPWLRDNVQVWNGFDYGNWEDGADFILRFWGIKSRLSQFKIHSSTDTPIEGENPVIENVMYEDFGPNIYYDVIPFEQIRTYDTAPPIRVTVDGMPVLCKGTHCSYTYAQGDATITSIQATGTTIQIAGSQLPLEADITSLRVSNQDCVISASSASQITCEISNPLVAGTWAPEVRTVEGLVSLDPALVRHQQILVVNSATPDVLYEEGGELVTISGAGFPDGIENGDNISVVFSDGTVCKIVSSTPDKLTCKPEEFNTRVRRRELLSMSLEVHINDQAQSFPMVLNEGRLILESITPPSASPIITQLLTLQLSWTYDSSVMDSDNFVVGLVATDEANARPNGDMVRWLNVVSYDKVQKTITVKYGGAYSGDYKIILESELQGAFRTTDNFEVKFEFTDFYPKQGSKYGGQLITIEGGHFSDDPQKNPIKIGYEYMTGVVHYCDVMTTSDAKITCRMRLDYSRGAGMQEMIVFASTFEEATCSASTCDFKFLDTTDLATIERKSVSYDSSVGTYRIEVNGYDIPDVSTDTIQCYIGGVEQFVVSVEPTFVIINVNEVKSGLEEQTFELYFEAGAVNGFSDLYLEGITLTPVFKGLVFNQVSSFGSTITAEVAGLGVEDEDVTLANAAGVSICESAKMISYGILECKTSTSMTFDNDEVKIIVKGNSIECNGELDCQISTFTSGQPSYQSPELTNHNTIKLTGTNLVTGTSCTLSYGGVEADSCEIQNPGNAIGVFDLGVPSLAEPEGVKLSLHEAYASHMASFDSLLENEFDTARASSSYTEECSFAGGCSITVPVQGLAANVNGGLQKVTACGSEAVLDKDSSDAQNAVFKAPRIYTVASEAAAMREQPVHLKPSKPENIISNNQSWADILFDGTNVPGIEQKVGNCWAGMKFDHMKTGILEEVRFFMDIFNINVIKDKLEFQGSNDDFLSEAVTILTVGDEVHEGWNSYEVDKPKFSSYRLHNTEVNGCNDIGELQLLGKEVIDDENSDVQCDVEILDVASDTYTALQQQIEYQLRLTSYVDDVYPNYGTVEGGTIITISGTDFNTGNPDDVTVLIDGIECDVYRTNAFTIECTSGPRPGLYLTPPTFEVLIAGRGASDVGSNIFRYMSLWSESSTWGGQFAPVDGESVVVPKGLNLLVDIDHSPILNLVLVDGGSIVFPSDNYPKHERTFDAKIIMVNDGVFEAGTEKHPYSSKLTITLHGVKYDPTVPIHGNKVLGCRNCVLDLHGIQRTSWTSLDQKAEAGSDTIVVQGDVQWEAGETIMITSTGFDRHEAEQRIIKEVTLGEDTTTLVLTEALEFDHAGATIDFGGPGVDTVEIRAEVALMERNVIFQGDEDSMDNEYGAHILIHAPGDNTNIGRISNVQLQNVGQFGQLGRYPIHFHMDGIVHDSYIENNVILNSVNRGTTLHGVQYLRIIRNVYYNCKGHTVFVEDGVETKNRVEYNLVINTEPSFSLLNTDSTPACFWLTNPDNILIGNHCAGSEHYGFWYDLVNNPTGPSVTADRCPINEKLGRFSGNVAHSMPNYGLRLFHGHSPREKGCQGIDDDTNPKIMAYYEDFLGYKAGRNGVIGGNFGAVTLRRIQAVDNGLAGIEYEKALMEEGNAMVEDSMVVGRSMVNWNGESASPHGFIAPRTDGSMFSNIRFYNYDFNNAAAVGTCSHCYSKPSTDSDARTVKTEQLSFSNVTKRVRYQTPLRGIIYDMDGTLTGLGEKTWATSFWQHNAAQPECQTSAADREMYDGVICNADVEVRRVVMYGYAPGSLRSRNLFVLPYDDEILDGKSEAEVIAYEANNNNYSIVDWREKANPKDHWCVPFVTGKKYYLRWEQGLDFEKMKFEIVPWLWDETDGDIQFELPHYDVRVAVHVDDNLGTRHDNNTIPFGKLTQGIATMGDNLIRNDTETRRINFVMNGDNNDVNRLTLTGVRCIGGCQQDIPDDLPIEDRIRRWSVLADWETNLGNRIELPQDGEDIIIPSNWQMLYDIPISETPKLGSLQINGRLTFEEGEDRLIKAYNLWVRAGELNIGSLNAPFPNKATIELQGDNTEDYWAFTPSIEAGNKNLVITGQVNMYGRMRDQRSRLITTVLRGMNRFAVAPGLDWQADEQLVLAPTNMRTLDTDICTIREYDVGSGMVVCKETLQGFHFGADDSTEDDVGVDMRGEVALLSRDIEITASQHDISHTAREAWECRILVSDFFENNEDMTLRAGVLQMDNVSVHKCSQKFTWKSAIKFENANMGGASAMFQSVASNLPNSERQQEPGSKVSNSAIHQGQGPGIIINKSSNIVLENNVVADFAEHGVWVQNSSGVTLDNNWLFKVVENKGKEPKMIEYNGWKGGFTLSESNSKMVVTNNVVAGTWHHGFHFVARKCQNDSGNFIFSGNVAHSISGYGAIAKNCANDCTLVSDFISYKVTQAAIMLGGPSKMNRGKNLKSIDTVYGIGIFSAGGGDVEISDSQVYGELSDNKDCPPGSPCDHCISSRGIILNQNSGGSHKDREEDFDMLPLFGSSGGLKGGRATYKNIRLVNFTSSTKSCGASQFAIMPYLGPDYTPYAQFKALTLDNVAREAMVFVQDPPQGWANISDCVEFTCTGMYNIVMHFEQTQAVGLNNPMLPQKFTIISNNKESVSAQAIPTCELVNQWNAWICSTDNIGIMIFDNLDADRMDRSLHPVYIQNDELGFNNRLNSYMDHCWDGFYTCQKRESRFPTLLWQERDYNIEFTGTPPQKQEFRLLGRVGSPGFMVTIKYNASGAYQLYDGSKRPIMPTDWDSSAKTWAAPTGQYCGEWRFEGVINRLQFYIENFNQNGCSIYIYPRDAIMLGIRLEFTMDEFFADGGIVTFADRMAAVLGIHYADIKVVSVYEGSTVIEFQVLQREEPENEDEEVDMINLMEVDEAYRNFITNEKELMGSRILSAQIEGVPLLTPYQQEQAANFDWSEFEEGFVEQDTNSNVKPAQQESQATTKVVTLEDGTQQVVQVDEDGEVVTKMKKIIVQQTSSPVQDSNAYLILCFVVAVAIIAIVGVICVIKRCNGKNNSRNVAQSVQQKVKGELVKSDFHDLGVASTDPQDSQQDENEQYRPNATDAHHLGVNRPGTAETHSAVETARDLLTERDVAAVRMEDTTEGSVAATPSPQVKRKRSVKRQRIHQPDAKLN